MIASIFEKDPLPLPSWLTWGNVWPVLSGLPGWIALGLALKKLHQEKAILEFTIGATSIEADEDDTPYMEGDGLRLIRALSVTITNIGQKPLTILDVRCRWSYETKTGQQRDIESRALVNKKLGDGDHCGAYPKIHARPSAIIAVSARDSTDREWLVPTEKIQALNAKGTKQWH